MPEPIRKNLGEGCGEGHDSGWDDVVDVICVGTAPGVLAYAICCAQADLDVLVVGPPAVGDPALESLYAAMTEDLGDPPAEPQVPVIRFGPPDAGKGPLEPFVGERLRQWSAHCLASPCGVMFTKVPDILQPRRTDGGETVTAADIGILPPDRPLEQWLMSLAGEHGVLARGRVAARVVLEHGGVSGVGLADGSSVGAVGGLAIGVGPSLSPLLTNSDRSELPLAVVGRRAGRFARVEVVARP